MSASFYMDKDSALHRLHPVTKIVLLLLSFVSAMMIEHPLWLLGLVMLYALAGARSGVWTGLWRVIWLLMLIALASFVIWSLAYAGKTRIPALGFLPVTKEGLLFGAGMGVRLDLMIFCGLIFLATTPLEDFTYGLTRMGLPFPVSFALSLSFRLAPLFGDTVGTILEAQKARGLSVESGGILGRMKNYVPLLAPVFASALRRADQLAMALESKGFGRPGKRGAYREYAAGGRDAVATLMMILLIALEVFARVSGRGMIN